MSRNRLMIEMTIFAALLFIGCSLVVINDKSKDFLIPKVDQKLRQHVQEEYSDIFDEIKMNQTTYNKKKATFEMKLTNKKNKSLYFIISYKKKKISSSYKEDYLEGKTLLSSLESNLEKEIRTKKYADLKITFTKKLNEYNASLHDTLILNQDICKLDIYNISVSINSKDFNKDSIIYSINQFYRYLKKNHYNPKYYYIKIVNSSDITQEIRIDSLNQNLMIHDLDEIVSGILNKDSTIQSKFHIKFEYTE